MAHTAPAKRRSAAEWKRLTAAWRRSGRSASAFAAEHGVRPRTLEWWRWNLRRAKGCSGPEADMPRLVAVEVVPDAVEVREPADAAWELRDARGLLLSVRTTIAAPELERVLLAMSPR